MSHIVKCKNKDLINPPHYVYSQLQYECIMGSMAYGVSSDNSDMDIYGFCIPNKNIIFPENFIHGFDKIEHPFEQYQQHHIKTETIEYDFTIYNITKYFTLCANGNPNMVDSLFVPRRCVTHSTRIGELVRENRKLFLSKKCWHTFKGYAYSQMHKMRIKSPDVGSKRYDSIMKHGYDVKFAYHVVRLLNEIEQILIDEDLDLERNREQLKSIRRGEWKQEDIEYHFEFKEKELEKIYLDSKLPHKPRFEEIRGLLVTCLNNHFGECISDEKQSVNAILQDIEAVLIKYTV